MKLYVKLYITLDVKRCNLQLNKLKSGIKTDTEVTLNLSSNVVSRPNTGTEFSHKLLSTNG